MFEPTPVELPKDLTDDQLKTYLTSLEDQSVYPDVKSLPYKDKVRVFRILLDTPELKHPILLLNLLNLVKGYNEYPDEFFSQPFIYVNSLSEIVDLKLDLMPETNAFKRKTAIYFYSLFKSLDKVEYSFLDPYVELPYVYRVLFSSTDFVTIGTLIDKAKFDSSELLYVKDAQFYVRNLANEFSIGCEFIKSMTQPKASRKRRFVKDSLLPRYERPTSRRTRR